MKKLLLSSIVILISAFSFAQNKGYEKTLEVYGGAGLGDDSKYSFGISFVNGYRLNESIHIGGGIGFKYAECLYFKDGVSSMRYESRDNKYLIPIYARVKWNLTNTNASPYLLADGGWTFDVGQNQYKNLEGLFIEPQFGMDFKLNGLGIYAALGVNLQNYHYTYYTLPDSIENKYMLGTFNLHFGVRF